MFQNRLDHWIRDCVLTDHTIRCNQLPDYMPSFGYKLQDNPDLASKWSRIIKCKSPNIFYQITALMQNQHISFDSKLEPRKTVLAYLLRRKHNESLTLGILEGGIRWLLWGFVLLFSPLYLLKWGTVGAASNIRRFLQFLIR
jgi:hypothetical protein